MDALWHYFTHIIDILDVPSGKQTKNYGTSSILMAKLPVNGRVQYQTVSLSEGTFAGGAP